MTRPLLKLAKQGDAIAIAALMNAVLNSQQIRVKARVQQGCLQVMLKSARPLHQHATVAFIRRGMMQLQPDSIEAVRAYAWQIGREFPDWIAEFSLPIAPSRSTVTHPPIAPLQIAATPTATIQPDPVTQLTPPIRQASAIASAFPAPVKSTSSDAIKLDAPTRSTELFKFGFVVLLSVVAYFVVVGA